MKRLIDKLLNWIMDRYVDDVSENIKTRSFDMHLEKYGNTWSIKISRKIERGSGSNTVLGDTSGNSTQNNSKK